MSIFISRFTQCFEKWDLFLSVFSKELNQITFTKQVLNEKLQFLFKVHFNLMMEYPDVNEAFLSK